MNFRELDEGESKRAINHMYTAKAGPEPSFVNIQESSVAVTSPDEGLATGKVDALLSSGFHPLQAKYLRNLSNGSTVTLYGRVSPGNGWMMRVLPVSNAPL
jgi:hypothetical protein